MIYVAPAVPHHQRAHMSETRAPLSLAVTMDRDMDLYSEGNYVPYVAQRRALAPSHALFDAGNWRRDLLARENAPQMSNQDEKSLMTDLDSDAKLFAGWGMQPLQQQCSVCLSVLPTPYLLSVHISEQHDSFFASQATQRMNVFRCLVEGCSSTFSSAAQRHQHLMDLHQIPVESGFDRIHLTAHQGQIRPNSSHSSRVDKLDKAAKPGPSQTTEQATHAALADIPGGISSAADLASDVSGAGLPQHMSDLNLQSNQPQHLASLHQRAAAQTADVEIVQQNKVEANAVTASSKQSRGGRGTPLGKSGKGRGRGRHRVAID